MNKSTRTVQSPLRLNPNGFGSGHDTAVRTEWSPESTSRVPIRSTWRDPIGSLLTNRRIAELQREGWYGEAAKRRALSRVSEAQSRTDIIHRCACGIAHDLRFLKWSYLPKVGYYCRACAAVHRERHQRDKELARELRERAERAVLERYV